MKGAELLAHQNYLSAKDERDDQGSFVDENISIKGTKVDIILPLAF